MLVPFPYRLPIPPDPTDIPIGRVLLTGQKVLLPAKQEPGRIGSNVKFLNE